MRIEDEIRARRPKMAERAKRSRSAAIRLHCLACCGGNAAEVKRCASTTCALHVFRSGKKQGEEILESTNST